MRQIYLLAFSFFIVFISQAQIVDIPDAIFKNALIQQNVDLNNDNEIQVSEAESISVLYIGNPFSSGISSLEGIESFVNLISLVVADTQILSLDLSNNVLLEELKIEYNNQLANLDLYANTNLITIDCNSNYSLVTLNVSSNINLLELNCRYNNSLTTLDLTSNTNLLELNCDYSIINDLNLTYNTNLERLSCKGNGLTTLDLSANTNLLFLDCEYNTLTLLDVSENTNLDYFNCGFNELVVLDVNSNVNLTTLICTSNNLSTLDVSENINLNSLRFNLNSIATIDVSANINLWLLSCSNNELSTLDISVNTGLHSLFCQNNNLTELYIKNNREFLNFSFTGNQSSLEYVCVDDFEQDTIQNLLNSNGFNAVVNSYCSFIPGGDFNVVQGETVLDIDSDGCDSNDIGFSNLVFNISDGINDGTIFPNLSGNYYIPLQDGVYNITPTLENPNYFSVSPENLNVDFSIDTNPNIQDFCVTPNGVFNDLEVSVFSLEEARPGFDVDYKISYKNNGTTTLNGSIDLSFSDNVIDYISSNPIVNVEAENQLSWLFSNLEPLQSGEIEFTMNLNTPTDPNFPLNANDILSFTATIDSNNTDETIENNTFTLNQTVVNSFDPNDKKCLEGEAITPDMVGRYIHYIIRFENIGTANAINIVVKDDIDASKFDINTLIPLNASHDFVTRFQSNNAVEFIFENIDLPFDDANNDGYIVFKIKTLDTLTIGDTFSNDAEIYFDFNFPIITNDYVTTVEDNLSISEFEFNSTIKLYPNPVTDILQITSEEAINSASIYDVNGRLLHTIVFVGNENQQTINVEQLSVGTYFVKLDSVNETLTQKIVKL